MSYINLLHQSNSYIQGNLEKQAVSKHKLLRSAMDAAGKALDPLAGTGAGAGQIAKTISTATKDKSHAQKLMMDFVDNQAKRRLAKGQSPADVDNWKLQYLGSADGAKTLAAIQKKWDAMRGTQMTGAARNMANGSLKGTPEARDFVTKLHGVNPTNTPAQLQTALGSMANDASLGSMRSFRDARFNATKFTPGHPDYKKLKQLTSAPTPGSGSNYTGASGGQYNPGEAFSKENTGGIEWGEVLKGLGIGGGAGLGGYMLGSSQNSSATPDQFDQM